MKISENRKRTVRIAEAVKTAVLGVLVISLVVLVAVYIRGIRVYEKVVSGDDASGSFNKLWSAQGGEEPRGLDPARLLPEFIGYKQAAFITPRGCVGSSDAVSALYDLVKPCLLELFGSSSVCRKLDQSVGKAHFVAAQSGEEFIYLRYHEPVLYQVIYAYGANRLTVSPTDTASGEDGAVGAYVSELMIVPDNSTGVNMTVAYAYDSYGNYYEFRPSKYTSTSSFYISKLANSDSGITTTDFFFLSDDAFEGSEPMITSETECTEIKLSVVGFGDEELKNGLLRLLGYNPDKLDEYDDNGADVYIDSHSQLRLGGGGVSFVTADASGTAVKRGLDVETLLGYTLDGEPSFFDKLTAADNLIRRLEAVSTALTGGEASLCLGEIYSENELLTVEYFLTYNNIRVGDGIQLRVTVADDTVCGFEMFPTSVGVGENETLIPEPGFILKQLKASRTLGAEDTVRDFCLRYNGQTAEWTAVLAED